MTRNVPVGNRGQAAEISFSAAFLASTEDRFFRGLKKRSELRRFKGRGRVAVNHLEKGEVQTLRETRYRSPSCTGCARNRVNIRISLDKWLAACHAPLDSATKCNTPWNICMRVSRGAYRQQAASNGNELTVRGVVFKASLSSPERDHCLRAAALQQPEASRENKWILQRRTTIWQAIARARSRYWFKSERSVSQVAPLSSIGPSGFPQSRARAFNQARYKCLKNS